MRKLTLAAALVALLAITAVAFAAKPKTGTYSGDKISLTVKHGKIVRTTGEAALKCTGVAVHSNKHLTVKKGKFHFSGNVRNSGGTTVGKLTVSGKFKTRTEAKGTYKFVSGSCSTGKKSFTASLGDPPD